jgi:peptidyl-prolyl cis-trans isomerase SurA
MSKANYGRTAKILTALACAAVAVFSAFPAAAEVIEEVVAQVNDHAIVLSEYKRSLQALRQDLQQDSRGALDLEAKYASRSKDVLRDLIDQQLLVQQATDLGMNADADVIKRMDAIRIQMKLPSMEALEEAVGKQGMSYEDFKLGIRDSILTQQVIGREVGSHVQVLPKEISDYYEKHKEELKRPEGVHIQQIFIITEGKPEEELPALQKKAEEALAKARSNPDFAAVAREYSEDATAQNGGDAGFFERGNMAPEIEAVAYSLKKNQISDIIKTKYGFLILKLLDHTQAGVPPLQEAETSIHEKIYYDKIQPALREYLTKLRQQSYIVIKPGFTDSGAPPAEAADASQPQSDSTAKR